MLSSSAMNCYGPELWLKNDITKAMFMAICDAMNCYPEPICEGGILYLKSGKISSNYKTIRFSYMEPISESRLPDTRTFKWPWITATTGSEWRQSNEVLLYGGWKICTKLKVPIGTECFSSEEMAKWRNVFSTYSVSFSIPQHVVCIVDLDGNPLDFKPKDLDEYTYIVQEGKNNTYKIGKANNPAERIKGLQIGSSEELSLIAFCIGGYTLETFLHRKFETKKKRGEWYNLTQEDLNFILELFHKISSPEEIKLITCPDSKEHKLGNIIQTYYNTQRKKLGLAMSKSNGKETEAYPECCGSKCWCYNCAMDTMRPDNYNEDNYDIERHKRHATKWAEDARRLWGWDLTVELQPIKPIFETEPQDMVSWKKYLQSLPGLRNFKTGEYCSYEENESFMKETLAKGHKDNVKVIAKWITYRKIAFECPFCWTRFSVNGDPYKGAKRMMHYHSNDMRKTGLDNNFIVYRIPHCSRLTLNSYYITQGNKSPFPSHEHDLFAIHVTDDTERRIKINKKINNSL